MIKRVMLKENLKGLNNSGCLRQFSLSLKYIKATNSNEKGHVLYMVP